MMKIFAFASSLIELLAVGLQTYNRARYRQFVKRIGHMIRLAFYSGLSFRIKQMFCTASKCPRICINIYKSMTLLVYQFKCFQFTFIIVKLNIYLDMAGWHLNH